MKLMIDWIHEIRDELSPFFISALAAITLIFIFAPEQIKFKDFLRLSLMSFFAAGISYWAAITYGFPYPSLAAIGGGFMGSFFIAGVFKILWIFMQSPLAVIQRFKK